MVMVWETPSPMKAWTDRDKKECRDNMRASLPAGWQILDSHMEPTNVPIDSSMKIRVKLSGAMDSVLYMYSYVAPGQKTYMLRVYSPDDREPPAFTRWVSSFSLINPQANTPPNASPAPNESLMNATILFAAFIGTIQDWKYKRRGGRKPTSTDWKYLAVAVSICVGILVLLGLLGASPEVEGRLIVCFFAVLWGLWELGRWHDRREYPV
jgi:hypothetical protein